MIINKHCPILVIICGKTIHFSLVVTKMTLSGEINPVIVNTSVRIYPFSDTKPGVNICFLTICCNKHTKCDGTLNMCCFIQYHIHDLSQRSVYTHTEVFKEVR